MSANIAQDPNMEVKLTSESFRTLQERCARTGQSQDDVIGMALAVMEMLDGEVAKGARILLIGGNQPMREVHLSRLSRKAPAREGL